MGKKNRLQIRSRVWIVDDAGETVFGLGRLAILETVQKLGSLHAAAKELNMSYRAIWGKIKKSEESLGFPLLMRKIGGASGGGSELTPEAVRLIEEYTGLFETTEEFANKQFKKKFSVRAK